MFILTFSCLLRRPCYHLALFMGFVVEGKTRASLSEMFLFLLLLFFDCLEFKEKVGFVLSRYCGSLYTFRMFCFVFIYDFRIFFLRGSAYTIGILSVYRYMKCFQII